MARRRLSLLVLALVGFALTATACTNPMAPKVACGATQGSHTCE